MVGVKGPVAVAVAGVGGLVCALAFIAGRHSVASSTAITIPPRAPGQPGIAVLREGFDEAASIDPWGIRATDPKTGRVVSSAMTFLLQGHGLTCVVVLEDHGGSDVHAPAIACK